ncbi:MAG: hypothetical protein R2762_20765 [Bryobacteraceae bacterium]
MLKTNPIIFLAPAALLGAGLLYVGSVHAQGPGFPPGVEVIPLGNGTTQVFQARVVLRPKADLGWHTHDGMVINILTKGTLTIQHANGCITAYTAPAVVYEEPKTVHRAVNNHPTESAEGYSTFLLPAGSPPLLPAVAPPPQACGSGGSN